MTFPPAAIEISCWPFASEVLGTFDLLHLPVNIESQCNIGHAIVNFMDVANCHRFASLFRGAFLPGFAREKVCRVTPARVQGLGRGEEGRERVAPVEYSEWQPLVLNVSEASRASLTCDSGEVPSNSEASDVLRECVHVAGVGVSLNTSHQAGGKQGHDGSSPESRIKAEELLGVRSYVVVEKPAGWELWTVGW